MERRFAIRISGQDGTKVLSVAREVEGLLLERGATAEVEAQRDTEAVVLLSGSASEASLAGGAVDVPILDIALDAHCASPRALVLDAGTRSVAAAAAEVLLALERLGIVPSSAGTSYSEEDERKIADRLEDLGYL
jgi:hypothetical protein